MTARELTQLVDDHLLVQRGETNVVLHVSDEEHVRRPVPVGRLIADLSAHAGPRESAAVHRLLHEHLTRP